MDPCVSMATLACITSFALLLHFGVLVQTEDINRFVCVVCWIIEIRCLSFLQY